MRPFIPFIGLFIALFAHFTKAQNCTSYATSLALVDASVVNPNNSLGPPNTTVADLPDDNDFIVWDMGMVLSVGTQICVRVKKPSSGGNFDFKTWSGASGINVSTGSYILLASYTNLSHASLTDKCVTLTATARYIKVTHEDNSDFSVDAVIASITQLNAGSDGNTTVCNSSTSVITLTNLISGEATGGTWSRASGVNGTFNAGAGTFTPASNATTSIFRYVITGTGGCPNDTSIATVTINDCCDGRIASLYFNRLSGSPDLPITQGGSYPLSTLANLYNLEASVTGTVQSVKFTITGPTASTVTDNSSPYNTPASAAWIATAGAYSINVKVYNADNATGTLCQDTTVNFTITNIVCNPDAGIDGSITTCAASTFSVNLFSVITNEISGGTWNRLTGTGGILSGSTFIPAVNSTTSTFRYVVTGISPCPNDTSIATVNFSPTVHAGTDGSITACRNFNSSIDLFGIITGEQTGGAWSTVSGAGATYTNGSSIFNPIGATSNYVFGYVVTGLNGCPNDTSVVTVNVIQCTETNICFVGTNNPSIGATMTITHLGDKVKILTVLSKNFVDNTYGDANSKIGWPKGHNLKDLVESDKLQLSLFDNSNVKKLEFNMDYISPSNGTSSGYDCLGVTGGEGSMSVGSATNVLSVTTSMDKNFNEYGYVLLTNSPPTDTNYTPNPSYPNWIYEVWYEVVVDADAFGASGFGSAAISGIHASPSKTGNNSEPVEEGPCYKPASLGNFVWHDLNADGDQDAGEPGISGVSVTLTNVTTSVTGSPMVTDANGRYIFNNLTPGIYKVTFGTPSGFVPSTANIGADDKDSDANVGGMTGNYILTSGQSDTTVDAGFYKTASLGDFVWEDFDGDGIQDGDEPGVLTPATVILTNVNTGDTSQRVTINGNYLFSGLKPGTYKVTFVGPFGYTFTTANKGIDSLDSDADSLTGVTGNYILTSGQVNLTVDAGFSAPEAPAPVAIGNFVWHDLNADGDQDAGEPGISGVSVTLTNVTTSVTEAPMITDANGRYIFNNLVAGTYKVTFGTPSGFVPSTANIGADDKDSDANVGGMTGNYILTSGQSDTTVDAGFYKTASLGDFVWNDIDVDGIQDPGEPGIPGAKFGVTVILTNVTTGVSTAPVLVDSFGKYLFSGLTPGTYKVTFGTPTGYIPTTADFGLDSLDSDVDFATGMTGNYVLISGEVNLSVDAGYRILPDLQPTLSVLPAALTVKAASGYTKLVRVVVRLNEVSKVATPGDPIIVRIPKTSKLSFTYLPSLTSLGIDELQNYQWTFSNTNPVYWEFTYTGAFAAYGESKFGFEAIFFSEGETKQLILNLILVQGSGKETNFLNNVDDERIDYITH